MKLQFDVRGQLGLVGVPGGHPLLVDHLQQHVAPANHLVVVLQGKGADLTSAVTLHAVTFEDAARLAGEGDLRGRP